MTRELVYESWAPRDSRWTPWVKPVLFACMGPESSPGPEFPVEWDATWAPPAAAGDTVLVLDLPGRDGVLAGLALAGRGYRPVPLYNAIPLPTARLDPMMASAAVVDVGQVAGALWEGAARLRKLPVAPDAPPAFLLDWNRRGPGLKPVAGQFDNRSVSFTTDFPSGNLLLSHGLRRAILVQPEDVQPQSDLAHTLRRWQEQGLTIELKLANTPGVVMPLHVPKPSWFGWICQRVVAAMGLRRGGRGGFGGWVPQASSG